MKFSKKFHECLPYFVKKRLWGDRVKYGLVPDEKDNDWIWWQHNYAQFNIEFQNKGVGRFINDRGYKVAREVNLSNCKVLEYGAGSMSHAKYWSDNPEFYTVVDVHSAMASFATEILEKRKVNYSVIITNRKQRNSLEKLNSDVVFSFYTLEHIYELADHVAEVKRILKPGGVLVGAIPMEGYIAWGLGRYLTTRRWFKNETDIDPDKIICWEHPNFASEVIEELERQLECVQIKYWPFGNQSIFKNFNLICSFVYRKELKT
jgi:SAM-dependent methyltransferase